MTRTIYNTTKNVIKFVISILLLLFFVSFTNADYNNFLSDLQKAGINTQSIQSGNSISRYTLTKLLNSVNCNDCINPNLSMINKYTYQWWNDFSIGRDFGDINYL